MSPQAPSLSPHTVLSLKGRRLRLCRAFLQSCYALIVAPFHLCTHFLPLFCWARPDIPQPSFAPFSPLSPLPLPKIPLTHYLHFLPFTLPANTSLSLICFSYSFSHLSLAFSTLISLFLLPFCISVCHLLTSTFFILYFTDLHCVLIRCANTKTFRRCCWKWTD